MGSRSIRYPRVTALAGGVGAARLLRGLETRVPPERLTVVVNTADDDEFFGLHVSPDLDTTIYNLAALAPRSRGWGLSGDSRRTLGALRRFYPEPWFRIGDRDFATHLFRTEQRRAGKPLHEITRRIAAAFGVRSRVLPMTDDRVRTFVRTRGGERLPFQEYFVHRGARDPISGLSYSGLRRARPAPGVLGSIRSATTILFPPSNPFTSILPILGVSGVRRALRSRRAPVVAVSPIAGGRAIRGPLGGMLRAHGFQVTPVAIAEIYDGLLDALVIDFRDRALRHRLERRGLLVEVTDIRMDTPAKSRSIAALALKLAERVRS